MKTKKQKRKIKLQGRILCHGNKSSCVQLFKEDHHRPLGKKTAKGTKPIKKKKKVYIKSKVN
jgi:hypothetical protein